jgi:hypothetical protein
MRFTITPDQAQNLSDMYPGEPIGEEIDVRRIEIFRENDIAVTINGRSLRFNTSDVDPNNAEIMAAIGHIIGVMAKTPSEDANPIIDKQEPQVQAARTPEPVAAHRTQARRPVAQPAPPARQAPPPTPRGPISRPAPRAPGRR